MKTNYITPETLKVKVSFGNPVCDEFGELGGITPPTGGPVIP